MQTVFIGEDGKVRTIITRQYVVGLYVAVYKEGEAIPAQLSSKMAEMDFHLKVRREIPNFLKDRSSDITTVVFRKFPEGDVIALFPEIQANFNRCDCQSYQHIGQHGPASYSLVDRTKLASADEYADLKAELETIGYLLNVKKRINRRWFEVKEEV
jgi:hypothetical protein